MATATTQHTDSQQGVNVGHARHIIPLIYVSFFLSGTAGLMYEIVWMRLLALSFGSMVFAVGAVLSSFMAGLALGNYFFGKASDAWRRPLLVYALLEAFIGLSALMVPGLLNIAGSVTLPKGSGVPALIAQASLTFALSFPVLIVPTALMGGTLPVLSRTVIRARREVAGRVGALYSINTFGGVLGVAIGGMILLPLVGMKNMTLVAAALNLSIACCVGLVGLMMRTPVWTLQDLPDGRGPLRFRSLHLVLLVAIGLSGLASMIYEVSWTRSLTLVIGSSIYAFSMMLLSFIFGIGLGSLIFARIYRKKTPSLRVFSYAEVAIAVSCIATVFAFDRLPSLFMKMYRAMAHDPGALFAGELLICFLVILVPTVLFGATLPMVAHLFAAGRRGVGRSIGTVYSSNTVGCIAGSVGASLLLIPLLGLESALRVAIGVNTAVALLVFAWSNSRKHVKYAFSVLCLALIAVALAAPKHWNKRVMSIGVAPNAVWLEKLTRIGDLETIASMPELLYYRDGLSATVAVRKDNRDISMSIDGKTDASASGDLPTELLVGYLPLFIHSRPETVMVIGLGSGISLAATLSLGVEYSECVEIEPAVVEASQFFSDANRKVLENPRSSLVLADARHHLLSTEKRYDVVTSEPSNPWIAGISSLFTKEFYEICARRLKPGGVMCQFIHGYNLTPQDFSMVMATFSSVFPHKQLWSSAFGLDYLMIGSLDIIGIDLKRTALRMRSEEVIADLAKIGISAPTDLFAHFLLQDAKWDEITSGAPVNTDDLPLLEFRAPKSLYLPASIIETDLGRAIHVETVRELPGIEWTDSEKARIHTRRGDLLSLHQFFSHAIREYDAATELDPDWHIPYVRRAGIHLMTARRGSPVSITRAAQDLSRAVELEPDCSEFYEKKALLARLEGKPEQAAQNLKEAAELEPRVEYYEDLVDILVDDLKNHREADEYVDEALAIFGAKASLLEKKGFIAEVKGKYALAAQYYGEAIEADPYTKANWRLGRLLLSLGLPQRALKPLAQAVRLGPTFARTHIALAKAYGATGQRREAIRSYRKALKIDPHNAQAQAGLKSLE